LTNLYAWLRFFHLLGLAVFLFAHGVSGGASLALRAPVSMESRRLLRLSQRSSFIANPSLIIVLVTGIWMAFAGHWWGQVWPWASLMVLVVVLGGMGFIAGPYYKAREAAEQPDDVPDGVQTGQSLDAVNVRSVGIRPAVIATFWNSRRVWPRAKAIKSCGVPAIERRNS
jgi:uncharacterized membrane protein